MPQHINGDTGEVNEGRDATVLLLEKEFPARAIKSRQGGGNKTFSYVSTDTVIRRLNEATDNQWDFQIVKYEFLPAINRDQQQEQIMLVQGRLTIPGLGSREGFGVQRLASPIVNTDDLLKAAAGDALKRAAVSFGVAIDLYGPDLEGDPSLDNVPGVTRGMPQNNATAPQRGATGGQAQSSQPSRSAAPAPSQRDPRIPTTYPRVMGVNNTADLIRYMNQNQIEVQVESGTGFREALLAAKQYGKEVHLIDNIIVPTGDINPDKPQYGPSTRPSDIANALGYWFTVESSEKAEGGGNPIVPAPRVGGTLPGEEPQDFDSDVPF